MGFPSPAQDYVESRIDLNVICQVRPSVSLFEIDGVIHLLDSGASACSGDMLCFELYGERAVGKLMGQSIITGDGETLEGASMEDIVVLGKVTLSRRQPANYLMGQLWDKKLPQSYFLCANRLVKHCGNALLVRALNYPFASSIFSTIAS